MGEGVGEGESSLKRSTNSSSLVGEKNKVLLDFFWSRKGRTDSNRRTRLGEGSSGCCWVE